MATLSIGMTLNVVLKSLSEIKENLFFIYIQEKNSKLDRDLNIGPPDL